MDDLSKVVIGWGLGTFSSVAFFYIDKRYNKTKKNLNMISLFEAFRDDWSDFKNEDDLPKLKFRILILNIH